jgi:uncharacterized protein (TIGR02466 family)
MQINAIFTIGVGVDKLLECVKPARKVFAKNENGFITSILCPNMRTSLKSFDMPPDVTHKESAELDKIKDAIKIKALDFLKTCGYKTEQYKCELSNIWLNEMHSHSYHKAHYHYGPNISGCFYVDVPKDSGPIVFSHSALNVDTLNIIEIDNYNQLNSSTWSFIPEEGDVYFWKSDLLHEVPQTNFEGIRRSIAFDISIFRR